MKLSELKTGEKAVIVKVSGHGGFRKRIIEMGFVKGKTVEVLLNAPLHDPVKYRIMGYEVSLRHSEAERIEVVAEQTVREDNANENEELTLNIPETKLYSEALKKRRTINVALVGNPNCGKTSLFNFVSGQRSPRTRRQLQRCYRRCKGGYCQLQGLHLQHCGPPRNI